MSARSFKSSSQKGIEALQAPWVVARFTYWCRALAGVRISSNA